MPQIIMIVSPEARGWKENAFSPHMLDRISDALTLIVEHVFHLEGKNDVAFDAYFPVYTKNEPGIQVEVRYTAGEDEYNTGQIFDPDKEAKKNLSRAIRKALNAFYPDIPGGISAWVIPLKESFFEMG